MKILIDTNILISAVLKPDGTPYKAFLKAVTYPNKGVICEQNVEELWRIFQLKFPTKIDMLEKFFTYSLTVLEVVSIPHDKENDEIKIRDVKDRPILRAAIRAKVDVILTGDKDFLEAEIFHPKIMTATEFIQTK